MSTGQVDAEGAVFARPDIFLPDLIVLRTVPTLRKVQLMLRSHKLVLLACAFIIGAQIPVLAADQDKLVAKVGSLEIRQSELDLAMGNLDPQLAQLPEEQKKIAALSGAIDVKLLAAGAAAEGLDKTEQFKQRMKFIADRELHNTYFKTHVVDAVTDAEVKARYDKEIGDLPKQEEVRARHILVKTEEEAKQIIADLDAGKDFVELAKAKSTDPNKSEGGDLGFFGQGRMVPEFEEAAFAMAPGSYSKVPVQTQFGFHVIKLEEKRDVPPPSFEEVSQQVRQLVMRDKYLELITKAKAKTKVEIQDEALRKGYEAVNQ